MNIDLRIQELEKRKLEILAENKAIEKSQEELWKKIETYQGEYADLREKSRKNLFEMVDIENQKASLENKLVE